MDIGKNQSHGTNFNVRKLFLVVLILMAEVYCIQWHRFPYIRAGSLSEYFRKQTNDQLYIKLWNFFYVN